MNHALREKIPCAKALRCGCLWGGEEVLFFNPLIHNELEGSDILLQDI